MTQRFSWICRLALMLTLVFPPLASFAGAPPANSAGPMTWQATKVPPPFPADEAAKRAVTYLGLSQPTIKSEQFVQVTDSTQYGAVRQTVFSAWLVTVGSVPVTNANTKASARIDLSVLIDANTKALSAAFTSPNAEKWVPRYSGFKEIAPDRAMESDGWVYDRPKSDTLNTSIVTVLSQSWKSTGLNPADAGQIFLRPLYVAPMLPAKRVNGKLQPTNPARTYWVVQTSGTKTREVFPPATRPATALKRSDTPYMSGLLELIDDIGARVTRGVYLP